MATAKDRSSLDPRDVEREALRAAETRVPCPACVGKGYVMIPIKKRNVAGTGLAYVREDCALCEKTGSVTVETRRAWKSGNPGKLRVRP